MEHLQFSLEPKLEYLLIQLFAHTKAAQFLIRALAKL